jgi:hypothetical protein
MLDSGWSIAVPDAPSRPSNLGGREVTCPRRRLAALCGAVSLCAHVGGRIVFDQPGLRAIARTLTATARLSDDQPLANGRPGVP